LTQFFVSLNKIIDKNEIKFVTYTYEMIGLYPDVERVVGLNDLCIWSNQVAIDIRGLNFEEDYVCGLVDYFKESDTFRIFSFDTNLIMNLELHEIWWV